MATMTLMNSVQHRNGPNQRPPNSIFGSSGSRQQLLSPELVCGFIAAVLFTVCIINYYSIDTQKISALRTQDILFIAFAMFSVVVTGIVFIYNRSGKRIACVQPTVVTDQESQNLVIQQLEVSNSKTVIQQPEISDSTTVSNPPPYDFAVNMPKIPEISAASLPPSYDKIIVV